MTRHTTSRRPAIALAALLGLVTAVNAEVGVTDGPKGVVVNTTVKMTCDAIVQIVNHGTAHRAETGLLLDRLGRSPGDLDYSNYCFEHP